MSTAHGIELFLDDEGEFDEVGDTASASDQTELHSNPSISDGTHVEWEVLTIPSNGNIVGNLRELKIRHRTHQAHHKVNRLQDIIADISFQYSHVV